MISEASPETGTEVSQQSVGITEGEMGGQGGVSPGKSVRQARVAARLHSDVAEWYRRLGGGSFTRGLERAFWQAHQRAGTTPGGDKGGDAFVALAGNLWPAWLEYTRAARPSANQAHAWLKSRLRAPLGRPPTPQQVDGVHAALQKLGAT